jgi:hypothetical protein
MSKLYVVEASAVTKAPLAVASRVITDPVNYPKWFKGARNVVAAGYPAVGGELSWNVGWGGSDRWSFRAKVIANELPNRLVMRVKTPSGESDVIHSFLPEGQGTRYTKRVEFEGSWHHRALVRLFLPRSVRNEVQAAACLADESA